MRDSSTLSLQEWTQLLDAVSFGYGQDNQPADIAQAEPECKIGLPNVSLESNQLAEANSGFQSTFDSLSLNDLKELQESSEQAAAQFCSSFTGSFNQRFATLPKCLRSDFIAENCAIDGPLYRHVLGQAT